ncbi:ArsR/SmtB family transcription factor [Phenylobacterium sp.]|uniref:ArsR/SmtB family transcription factor n=1 Tax=Phenylobacterium sp. TaxID=1871053 RepID=UPI0035B2D03A
MTAAAARVFHALGEPTRRAIVERLAHGPLPASQLAAPLGVTVTAVGQHLKVLEASRLVLTEKVGRTRTCRIDPAGFAVLDDWIASQRSLWERRLDRLGELLAEQQERGS